MKNRMKNSMFLLMGMIFMGGSAYGDNPPSGTQITPLQLATNLKYTKILTFFKEAASQAKSKMAGKSGRTYGEIAGETVYILNTYKTEAEALTVIQSMSWPLVGLSANIPVSKESKGLTTYQYQQ